MLFQKLLAIGAVTLLASGTVYAHDYKAGALEIQHPWARATAPGQTMGAGYFLIKNTGDAADKLVSVSTGAADKAEIHEVTTADNMVKMGAVDGLDIAAHGTAELAPGGYHVMFMGLKAPFTQGTKIPATLTFAKAGELKIEFKVEPLTYKAGTADHGDHSAHGAQSGHSAHDGQSGHMDTAQHKIK